MGSPRIVSQLSARAGGDWSYDASARRWYEHKGRMYARYVHTGGVDVNGEAAPGYALVVYDMLTGHEVLRFNPR